MAKDGNQRVQQPVKASALLRKLKEGFCYGEGYLEATTTGRSNLHGKVDDLVRRLAQRTEEVNEDFIQR